MGRPSSHCVWCTRIRSFCLLKTCGDKSASAHTDSQGGITGRAHTLDVKHTCDVLHPKSVQALPWSGIYCFAAACMFPLIWWMSKCFWIGSVTHVTNDMLTSPHTYLISCCSCNTCHWPQYLLIKCFVTLLLSRHQIQPWPLHKVSSRFINRSRANIQFLDCLWHFRLIHTSLFCLVMVDTPH